jgi:hypothetical protein
VSDLVVAAGEAVELSLELFLGGGGVLPGQVFLEGLLEAFDLAAGLGVVRPGVLGADAQAEQFKFRVPACWCWWCAPKIRPLSVRKGSG